MFAIAAQSAVLAVTLPPNKAQGHLKTPERQLGVRPSAAIHILDQSGRRFFGPATIRQSSF